jgi:hypothetical protein
MSGTGEGHSAMNSKYHWYYWLVFLTKKCASPKNVITARGKNMKML